ncbi:MAG TPA: YgcG family protein [Bradyrhizobium sp.]|uniref:TPM domain-containing protein n=1 Tax=Bradyrhizobium sp. TaxID=376 RepID=UPI002C06461A|nr:YgcG family protein [Bradyrhizobium sp.]HLZ03512.1 YgcG family protein [Bradyrhizobium sp.]
MSDGAISVNTIKTVLLALLLCFAQAALADVDVPQLKGRVVDLTNTLTSDTIDTLNQRIRSFEQRKGSQIAVLIVPTTQPETIEQYSIRVAEAWKIGRKKIDDGTLLVIAKNDHKLRIEVGYGLEGALTDVTSRRIIDEVIAPRFKTGDFAGGISAGLTRMIGVIDGEPLPAPAPEASHGSDVDWNMLSSIAPFFVVGAIFVGVVLRAMLGPLIGAGAAGGLVGVIAWLVVGSLLAGVVIGGVAFLFVLIAGSVASAGPPGRGGYSGPSSSGWSGGGSSWSSDSSSSSDSGGGGGDFGGGGASGSW